MAVNVLTARDPSPFAATHNNVTMTTALIATNLIAHSGTCCEMSVPLAPQKILFKYSEKIRLITAFEPQPRVNARLSTKNIRTWF